MSCSFVPKINKLVSIAYALGDSIESDLINFVSNQEQCRRQWEKAETELKRIKDDEIPLKEQNRSISVQLELARNQLDNALRKRPVYEKRIKYLEQQLHAIASLLTDAEIPKVKGLDRDAILRMTDIGSGSLDDEAREETRPKLGRKSLIPSDFDDSGEETMESHLVRAASNVKNPSKRRRPCDDFASKKSANEKHTLVTPLVTISPESSNSEKQLPKPAYIGNQSFQSVNQCCPKSYEPVVTNSGITEPSAPPRNEHPGFRTSYGGLYPDIGQAPNPDPQPIVPHTSKPHNLIQKKEIKPGKCTICKKGIGFQKPFFRCQDCTVKCHEACKVFVSTSCSINTNKLRLEEEVPFQSSMKVPPFIVDCVREIECKGLGEQGLYRVSGALKEANDVKKRLRNGVVIDLAKISDINTLTTLLKTYLRELAEPLVTRQYHGAFLECGKKEDMPRLYKLIDNLPLPNRHTLAFLFHHFRKVARTQENLMDFKALARVLGPALIGHSCLNPTSTKLYEEIQLQPKIVELLFGISDDYWGALLGNFENSVNLSTALPGGDPDRSRTDASAANSPLLGRIDGIHNRRRYHPPTYPMAKNMIEKLGKKKYFDSPIVRY